MLKPSERDPIIRHRIKAKSESSSHSDHELPEDPFLKALMDEDELGVVIRAHIHIERSLNELLGKLLPSPDELKGAQLDYFQRVHLVVALGLRREFKPPLLALGKLRNVFAHELETALTEERVNSFYSSFEGEDRNIINMAYDRVRIQRLTGPKKRLKQLSPLDRFVLCIVSMRSALLAALMQVDETPSCEDARATGQA